MKYQGGYYQLAKGGSQNLCNTGRVFVHPNSSVPLDVAQKVQIISQVLNYTSAQLLEST